MIDVNNSQNYDAESLKEFAIAKAFGDSVLGSFMAESAAAEELDDPVSFIKENYPGRRIWRFILTHPDLDHMRGIHSVFNEIGVDNFWDTRNTKSTPSTFRSDADRIDWKFYQERRADGSTKFYTRGDAKFAFALDETGEVGGDGIEILSPFPELVEACNKDSTSNDLSVVIRVSHAGRCVLLPGDAEDYAWASMVHDYGAGLKSDVLKASHHGRDSGYNLGALNLIHPDYVVVSVGRKPVTDAHQKYKYHCANVYSTRRYGRLKLEIDDAGAISWMAERSE